MCPVMLLESRQHGSRACTFGKCTWLPYECQAAMYNLCNFSFSLFENEDSIYPIPSAFLKMSTVCTQFKFAGIASILHYSSKI